MTRDTRAVRPCMTPPDCPNTWDSFGGDERECCSNVSSKKGRIEKAVRVWDSRKGSGSSLQGCPLLTFMFTLTQKHVLKQTCRKTDTKTAGLVKVRKQMRYKNFRWVQDGSKTTSLGKAVNWVTINYINCFVINLHLPWFVRYYFCFYKVINIIQRCCLFLFPDVCQNLTQT